MIDNPIFGTGDENLKKGLPIEKGIGLTSSCLDYTSVGAFNQQMVGCSRPTTLCDGKIRNREVEISSVFDRLLLRYPSVL